MMAARQKKQYRVVSVGDTFHLAGWLWTVTEVAPNGRTYWAETPLPDKAPLRREFSAEVAQPYYGEPDPEDNDDW